jgi:hypothetical protein
MKSFFFKLQARPHVRRKKLNQIELLKTGQLHYLAVSQNKEKVGYGGGNPARKGVRGRNVTVTLNISQVPAKT